MRTRDAATADRRAILLPMSNTHPQITEKLDHMQKWIIMSRGLVAPGSVPRYVERAGPLGRCGGRGVSAQPNRPAADLTAASSSWQSSRPAFSRLTTPYCRISGMLPYTPSGIRTLGIDNLRKPFPPSTVFSAYH